MHDLPPFGRELAEAQERLDEVLARCAIWLKAFGGARGANDNLLFPGVSVPAAADDGSCIESPRDTAG